jgi:hypothetical protein
MTRREWLINLGRVSLLRWRVLRGRSLPAFASGLLVWLDRLSLRMHERAVDRPWTSEASSRIDRILAGKERDR